MFLSKKNLIRVFNEVETFSNYIKRRSQRNIQYYSNIIKQMKKAEKNWKKYKHQNINLIMSKSIKAKIYIQINLLPQGIWVVFGL